MIFPKVEISALILRIFCTLEQFTLTPVKISSKNKMILFFLQNLSKNFKYLVPAVVGNPPCIGSTRTQHNLFLNLFNIFLDLEISLNGINLRFFAKLSSIPSDNFFFDYFF